MVEEKDIQYAKDEDLERAKALWKENGRSIVAGVVIGLSSIAGYNFWQSYEKSQGENASSLYEQLINAESTGASTQTIADAIRSDFSKTPYAIHSALFMAKEAVEADQLDKAAEELQWVLNNTEDPGLLHIARLRLAAVLNASGKASEVVDLLAVTDESTFESHYAELLGDAHAQLGQYDMAKSYYEKSMENAANNIRDLIKLKLDNLTNS